MQTFNINKHKLLSNYHNFKDGFDPYKDFADNDEIPKWKAVIVTDEEKNCNKHN